jgi:protein-S-isoprenylcysteine O-methyltransferase Ste14
MDQLIHWLPLVSIVCFVGIVFVRTYTLRRRGIRAQVADPERSTLEKILEIGSGIIFWVWVALVAVATIGRLPSWFPGWMTYELVDATVAKWIGALLVIVPVVVYPITLAQMGDSWRMGIDREAHDPAARLNRPQSTLITHGLYRFARNPIYVIVDMLFFGAFLVHGQVIFLVCAVAFAYLVHRQVLREEKFLAARYGDEYEAYRKQVRRYGFV